MDNRRTYNKNERIGRMIERPEIHFYTETVGASGERVQEWQLLATVWASVKYQDLRSQERELAGQETVRASVQFSIRQRSDVNETMRVYFNNRLYDIESISESNDRHFNVLTCRQYDTLILTSPGGSVVSAELMYIQEFTGETGNELTVTVYGGNLPDDKARVWVSLNGQEIAPSLFEISGATVQLGFDIVATDVIVIRFAI